MTIRNKVLLVWFLAVLTALTLPAQEQLTARDVFWSGSDLLSVTPNPAAHKQSGSSSPPRRADDRGNSASNNGSSTSKQQQKYPSVAKSAQLVVDNGYGAAPHVVPVDLRRLGLRCSLMLHDTDGQYVEVTPDKIFHSGDHIRLSFLANAPGYFYVIQQSSRGGWSPIFPPSGSDSNANKIAAGKIQIVPGGRIAFGFDQNRGDEKLYVILSRTPIGDIDKAIQNLKKAQAAEPQTTGDSANYEMVDNTIPDVLVKQLTSRDLVLVEEQKVDESSTQSSPGEKAIYVVSKAKAGGPDSQVVLSLDLHHE